MELVSTAAELRTALSGQKACAFVPTMGNLHEGHLSLVKQARNSGFPVVVSVFVNPLQFAAGEDFERYPRTLGADCALVDGHADIVFAPSEKEIYPAAQQFYVIPPRELENDLCGAFRPGHFRGVATVVMKLFNLVRPSVALFGKKDYQQLVVIRQMTTQFNLPIEIRGGETIRAEDGLALSSRNGYLSVEQRREAPRLFQTLNDLKAQLEAGNHDFPSLESAGCEALKAAGWKVDYVAIRRPDLSRPTATADKFVILAAAYLGKTRLIDNLELGYNLSLS
ncbi:MAG: pantoate--beta-alanine ligase [Thiobacillaceae bacterium]